MDNSQTLELQIKSKAQEAKASVESLVKSLTNVENVLTNIYLEMGSIEKKADSSINKTTTTATKNVNQLKQSTDKATNSADQLSNAFKKVFTFAGVKRLTTTALGWMNEAIDYTEQLNLFNVVFDNTEKNGKKMFSELGKSALQFQYKMNEAFGTNKTQTLYMQGIFESMGETVGIEDKYSSIMSETMTKLTYDLASLYNKTEKTTAEAIRAGVYAGQTKPLRSYGIDVTQSSLQPIVKELGITDEDGNVKSVKNMSQAEKEILRYIATLKQAKIAMGDLANTIESPSNQLKVFRQQLVETKVAFSSLFIGALSNALPYANAFLMVIKEVSKAIATMFGIELKDYNSGIASQEGIYDGIADSADDASDAVKKLKRQTLGFDEIHNINENKGSGTSASGGIDQRLLDAIQGYDNGMDKVRMKATEIRDRIMEWLGFTKKIDPLTGEVSFKYKGIKTTLKNIWTSFKNLNTQGKILVGLGLTIGAIKLWNAGKNLVNVFGNSGLFKVISSLLTPTTTLLSTMKEYIKYSPSLSSGIKTALSDWGATATVLDKFKVGLVGVIGLSVSLEGMSSSMKSVAENGITLGNSLTTLISSLGGVASGAMIGTAIMPGLGTAIGAVGGAIATLIAGITSYNSSAENAKTKTDKLEESLNELQKKRKENLESSFSELEMNAQLLTGLENLIDSNGKVKTGYEERANFILGKLNEAFGTEYQLTGNQITLNGEAITSYRNIESSIKDLITQKKIQLSLQVFEEDYVETLKKQKELKDEIDKRTQIATMHTEWYKNALKGTGDTGGYSLKEIKNGLEYDQKELERLNKLLGDNNTDLQEFSDIFSAYSSGNIEEIKKILNEYGVSLETETTNTAKSLDTLQTKISNAKTNITNTLNGIKANDITINTKLNTNGLYSSWNTAMDKFSIKASQSNNILPNVFPSLKINGYANGGFPEDGWFRASHGELMGKFDNGQSVVASNMQITQGIEEAAYRGYMRAISDSGINSGQSNEIDVHVHTDEGTIIDRIEQRTKQTGKFPLTIPTY